MTRPIKFRAFELATKTMVSHKEALERMYNFDNYGIEDGWVYMQFTGLKDKNGKEIYEGDVVRDIVDGMVAEVKWLEAGFDPWASVDVIAGRPFFINPSKEVEVIGNIYSNPELIK